MLDAHQHFWTVARGDYGWMSPELTVLYRDFGPADLQPLMGGVGVKSTVLVQAAETEAETEFLLDIAAKTDSVAGVVGWIDMLGEAFSSRLDHYLQRPKWVGLRPMLQEHDPVLIADHRFQASLAYVARRDVPFDILTFPRHLPAMIHAVHKAPYLRAIVDHISKPDMTRPLDSEWASNITKLAAVPNLHCKISGLVTEAGPDWSIETIRPFVIHVARAFGPQRLVYGSDWPVCNLVASYGEVYELARIVLSELFGPEDLDGIFSRNGQRFYRLTANNV